MNRSKPFVTNQKGNFLLSLAATAQKFSLRPSDLIGIDCAAEPVIALAFDLAAAVRLQRAESEWQEKYFGEGSAPKANPNEKIHTEYW